MLGALTYQQMQQSRQIVVHPFLSTLRQNDHISRNHLETLSFRGHSPYSSSQSISAANNLESQVRNISSDIQFLKPMRQKILNQEFQCQDENTTSEVEEAPDYQSSITMPLSHPNDKNKISELQCFLRGQIEFFTATAEDVNTYSRGRNKNVEVGQVGIRCAHCGKLPVKARSKGSSYFPFTLDGIYQVAQNMNKYHFCAGCPAISKTCKSQLNNALSGRSSDGCGKDYWSISAENMGLIETNAGLRFENHHEDDCLKVDQASLTQLELATRDTTNIIDLDDKRHTTDYIFILFSQTLPYNTAKMGHVNRQPALVCKHCQGCDKTGKFFRKKVSSVIKNENITHVDKHMSDCKFCPNEIKAALKIFKKIHPYQLRKLKRGDKNTFFTKIIKTIDEQPL